MQTVLIPSPLNKLSRPQIIFIHFCDTQCNICSKISHFQECVNCMMVCAQWGSVMTDSNKSEDDLPEFPGSNQTIKLTISNHELFYILCVVFPGAGRRLTTLTYSQLGTWSWSGQGQGRLII